MSNEPAIPKIIQPVCFSLRNLHNPELAHCAQNELLNMLTPSPERPPSNKTITISDDSDTEDSLPHYHSSTPLYPLPPTPTISDNSDDVVVLTCLPTVKNVTSLKNCDALSEMRLECCRWLDCFVKCETRENLHKHIVTDHMTREELSCSWIECTLFGKMFRSVKLFDRHVLEHTQALNFPCIWEKCSQRFVTDNLLQRHLVSHLKLKKKEESLRSNQCRKKVRCFYKPVAGRQSYHSLLSDKTFDQETMSHIKRRIVRLHRVCNEDKTLELPSKKVGYRQDDVVGRQWLLTANCNRLLTRWTTQHDKVSVNLRNCPDSQLHKLGVYFKQPRKRKQGKS